MNEIRMSELIDSFFNCDLEWQDRAGLERALLRSSQARELFWRKAEIHEGLREWGLEHWDSIGRPASAAEPEATTAPRYASFRRVVRAAAIPLTLLIGSMVGMGVAWAVVPQIRTAFSLPLRLTNAGFEDEHASPIAPEASADRLANLPLRFGEWKGDRVRVCGAEKGIVPAEGKRMLALERALPGPGDRADTRADSCDVFQLVDLTAYRAQIANGGCALAVVAKVLDGDDARTVPTHFIIRVHVFGGDAANVLATWPHSHLEALATGTERIESFGGAGVDWCEISAQPSLPKDATFAVLEIDATSMDRSPGRDAAVFDRHYCDDVRATITLPPNSSITH